MFERRERVRRFARLGNYDDESVGIRYAFAIPVLAGDLDLSGQLGNGFEPVLRGESGIIAGAACENQYRIDLTKDAGCVLSEKTRGDRFDALQRVRDRARLLEDFLLHEVAIRTQLGSARCRLNDAHFALYALVGAIDDAIGIA